LEACIANGGSVFIDTGWQYWIPDWQLDEVPEFFPTNSLSWTDLGKASGFETNPAFVTNKVDLLTPSPNEVGAASLSFLRIHPDRVVFSWMPVNQRGIDPVARGLLSSLASIPSH
jgi:hypothetical protein